MKSTLKWAGNNKSIFIKQCHPILEAHTFLLGDFINKNGQTYKNPVVLFKLKNTSIPSNEIYA